MWDFAWYLTPLLPPFLPNPPFVLPSGFPWDYFFLGGLFPCVLCAFLLWTNICLIFSCEILRVQMFYSREIFFSFLLAFIGQDKVGNTLGLFSCSNSCGSLDSYLPLCDRLNKLITVGKPLVETHCIFKESMNGIVIIIITVINVTGSQSLCQAVSTNKKKQTHRRDFAEISYIIFLSVHNKLSHT